MRGENVARAERAHRGLNAYMGSKIADPEDVAIHAADLICDLLHLVDTLPVASLGIPEPPPEFDSGYRNPHANSTHPLVVVARGINHYLGEIHPDASADDDSLSPLPEDVDTAVRVISEFLTGEEVAS